jgi:hypothetical protein
MANSSAEDKHKAVYGDIGQADSLIHAKMSNKKNSGHHFDDREIKEEHKEKKSPLYKKR